MHYVTTAWRIPWTEELGRLQFIGLQRVRHDCETNFQFFFFFLKGQYNALNPFVSLEWFSIQYNKDLNKIIPKAQTALEFCCSVFTNGEGNGNPLQYSCLENSMDGGAWQATVHGVTKSRTRLSDFTFTFHFHALEKEMAAHSSVLAWRIPGMGEPGGLPSMGSHRVGHN